MLGPHGDPDSCRPLHFSSQNPKFHLPKGPALGPSKTSFGTQKPCLSSLAIEALQTSLIPSALYLGLGFITWQEGTI